MKAAYSSLLALGVLGGCLHTARAASCSYHGSFDLRKINPDSRMVDAVVLIGKPRIRCTVAAQQRLRATNVCYRFVDATQDAALFRYMRCLHPETDVSQLPDLAGGQLAVLPCPARRGHCPHARAQPRAFARPGCTRSGAWA